MLNWGWAIVKLLQGHAAATDRDVMFEGMWQQGTNQEVAIVEVHSPDGSFQVAMMKKRCSHPPVRSH